ncbi:MAG: response regulator [Deltaproteobacteria bacterium]|nr:response regulator [Deltaproteobacteria bacterium]
MDKRVLCIGPCEGVEDILPHKGYTVRRVEENEIPNVLGREGAEAILVDITDAIRGIELIKGIRQLWPSLWMVAISDNRETRFIINILKTGASDYLIKPIETDGLLRSIKDRKFLSVTEIETRTSPPEDHYRFFPSRFYNASFVTEYGKIESLRARRYERDFSLILIEIEDFYNLKKKYDKQELLGVLRDVIKAVIGAVRDCDAVGMVEGKRIVAILPETDFFVSLITTRMIKKAVEGIVRKEIPLSLTFSQASYPRDGKGYGELLSVAEEKIKKQREGLWVKLGLEERPFWEVVSALLEGRHNGSISSALFKVGKGEVFPAPFLEQIQEMTLQEIAKDPKKKGVLYLVLRKGTSVSDLKIPGSVMTKIFVVGKEKGWDTPNVTVLYQPHEHLLDNHFFILLMREDMAYALLCREEGKGFLCFHTVDPYLIDGLITKFQWNYSLEDYGYR